MKREQLNWILGVTCGVLLGVTAFLGYRTYSLKQELADTSRTTQTVKQTKKIAAKGVTSKPAVSSESSTVKDTWWQNYSKDEVVVNKFFTTMFEYDSASFMPRFDEAKKYADQQAINLIIGTGGKPEQPKSTIESKLLEFKFYPQVWPKDDTTNDDNYRAIVTVKTLFTYQGTTTEGNMDYAIEYDRTQKKITHLAARNEVGDMD